jgi:crotonobetainyl-CoA:carnitine CoA-transferase CaiB-like acyl-CoA transferase
MDWNPDAAGPLAGLKILDLSRLLCGNLLTLSLADFGADVVKVEDRTKGDPLRDWKAEGHSLFWKVYGRNKRSLALDLRSRAGRAVVGHLACFADVLVESFRPGTMESMGLGPTRLQALNPRIVVVRISGFGQTGPYRDRPGFGTLIEAMSGLAARSGFPDRPPLLPTVPLADMVAGIYGAFATMVALQARTPTGGGQVIDLSLLEPLVSFLGADAAIWKLFGRLPLRTGNRSETSAPRNVYTTADGGYVAISASIQSMAERLFGTIGRPELADDPRFRTNADRLRHNEELDLIIQAWIGGHDQAECLRVLAAEGVTAGPVYDAAGLAADPHVLAREVLVDLPDAETGSILAHNITPRLDTTPGRLRRPAPAIGADSRAVLRESGMTDAEIDALIHQGVVSESMAVKDS